VAAIDTADDDLELRLALLCFADALGAAAKAARRTPDAPQIAVALLGLAIVVQAADTVNSLVRAARVPSPAKASVAAASVSRPPLRLTSIGQLFGSRVAEAPAGAAATDTSLVLTGVIADADPQRGFGILGSEPNHTSLYGVGDALPDSSRLMAVYADRVEIERAGLREVLSLPLSLAATGHPARIAALANGGGENPTPPAVTHGHPDAETPPAPPPAPDQSRGAAIAWTTTHLGSEKTDSAGHLIGYDLTGVGEQAGGLHSGDILVAVNGTRVTDRDRVSQLLDSEGRMRLTVVRDGFPRVVTLPAGSPLPAAQ